MSKRVHPLASEYDELAALYLEAERVLREVRCPATASVLLEHPSTDRLAWMKYGSEPGAWRIVFKSSTADHRPVTECPVHVRVRCAPHVARLYEELHRVVEQYRPELVEAVSHLRRFIDTVNNQTTD